MKKKKIFGTFCSYDAVSFAYKLVNAAGQDYYPRFICKIHRINKEDVGFKQVTVYL